MSGWTQAEAIALCRKIEDVCPAFGCHVALTGGVLYKVGERKDLDILFTYRGRKIDCFFPEELDGEYPIGDAVDLVSDPSPPTQEIEF